MFLAIQRIFFILTFSFTILSRICEAQDFSFFSSRPIPTPYIQGVNLLTGQIDEAANENNLYEKYQEGWNQVGQESFFLSKDDFRIGKIKTIYFQSPTYNEKTHLFYENGVTKVYEANNRISIYRYTDSHFLYAVEYYQMGDSGALQLFRCERLYWQEVDSSFRLISRTIENERGQVILCYCFFYNFQGQLIKETLVGNLDGNCSVPFKIEKDGYPKTDDVESYSVNYTYSEDDSALLVTQTEDSGLTTIYRYDSSSKQCLAVLKGQPSHWVSRYFYFYDNQGLLKQVICDDGQNQQADDLTGVTWRRMISLQLGCHAPLTGKPLKIEESYWEPGYADINGEIIYKFTFNYDEEGRLISNIDSQAENMLKAESEHGSKQKNNLPLGLDLSNPCAAVSQNECDNANLFCDQISVKQVWDGIISIFFSCFHQLQLSAHQVKMKWNAELNLPTPIAQTLEKMGKTLFGELNYLLMGPHFEETQVDCYGQNEISNKVRVTFINGILNTRNMMLNSLEIISGSHGGVKVHYVFRPTEGWTWDISRAIMIKTAFKLGFRSLHAHLLAKMWRDLIQEMGGVEGGGVIIHYAHSLGGSETDRARELLTAEEQKMIRVVTFGSPTLICNIGFQSVLNIVSVNDGVCSFFLEPLGHIRNYFDPNTNVRFYNSILAPPCWPTDHLLNGPTYGPILRELGEQFLTEFATPFVSETP